MHLPLLSGLEVFKGHQWLHAQGICHLHNLGGLHKVHFAGAELALGIDLDAHLQLKKFLVILASY